jgi:hypothetical protein
MPEARIQRSPRIVFRRLEAGAGGVLLHLDSGEYRHVNETGALIWGLLAEGPTLEVLLAAIRDVVSNPPANLDEEVTRFLSSLKQRGLIEEGEVTG